MIYTRQELEQFLIALDSELSCSHTIIVIGGAAATLHYFSKGGTVDIDTYNSVAGLKEAYQRTLIKYPALQIPLNAAAPAQGPINLKDRLEIYDKISLLRLQIFIPEVHDWILLKTARCEEKDISDIKDLAKQIKIDPSILKERFKGELLPQNPGNDEYLLSGYLYMISVIFGEQEAEEHQRFLNDKF